MKLENLVATMHTVDDERLLQRLGKGDVMLENGSLHIDRSGDERVEPTLANGNDLLMLRCQRRYRLQRHRNVVGVDMPRMKAKGIELAMRRRERGVSGVYERSEAMVMSVGIEYHIKIRELSVGSAKNSPIM